MHDGSEQGHRVRSLDFGTFTHAVNASTDHWWYRCKKKHTQINTKKIYSSPLCTIRRLKTGERGKMQWLCLCASIHFICALRMCAKLTLTTAKLAVTCLRHKNAETSRPGRRQEWGGDKGSVQIKISKTVTPHGALLASAPYVHVRKQTRRGPLGDLLNMFRRIQAWFELKSGFTGCVHTVCWERCLQRGIKHDDHRRVKCPLSYVTNINGFLFLRFLFFPPPTKFQSCCHKKATNNDKMCHTQ